MRRFQNEDDSEAARQFKRVLEDLLFEAGIRVNEMAARLNISSERSYKYLNPGSLNNNMPCYLLPMFVRGLGPELLQYLAHECGFIAVPLPAEKPSMESALQATAAAMEECGQAIGNATQALLDGRVTAHEWQEFQRELREALQALVVLQEVLGGMRR